jgi:hypothetical protein
MAADRAATPFRNNDADTAVCTGNWSNIKSGEKMRPPPRPTMVNTKDALNISGKRINQDIRFNHQ